MQFKGKGSIGALIPPPLRWRLTLAALSLLCVVLMTKIWLSGSNETRESFNIGRRLLVRLDDGTIEGKLIKAEDLQNASADKSAPQVPVAPQPQDNTAALPQQDPDSAQPITLASGPAVPATTTAAEPNPDLSQKGKDGPLPIIGRDGTKSWKYYAKPYERKGGQPMIAIIVTGLGENKTVTDAATHLSENVTLSFSPYAKDINTWIMSARGTGHEVLVDLPMEPSDYPATDPGPESLMTTNPPELNQTHLDWVMSRIPAYIGLLTPQNEAFSANNDDYKLLLQSLANRGLMIVIGHEPAKNETKETIDGTTTANVTADVLLDEDLSASAIQSRLTALEEMAKKRGYAIGVAQSLPVTIEQLRNWSETLNKKGLVLAPVTAIAKLRFS